MEEQYYSVGRIVNTQGIKGEVRVISTTDFPEERFAKGQTLYLFQENRPNPIPLAVGSRRPHKQFEIVAFEGHPSINDVEGYKGGILKIKETDRKPLEEGEFYFNEIIGLAVFNEDGEKIGEIKEILTPGANDVWVVKRAKKADLLIPYIKDCVKSIDLPNQKVIVHLLEGLE